MRRPHVQRIAEIFNPRRHRDAMHPARGNGTRSRASSHYGHLHHYYLSERRVCTTVYIKRTVNMYIRN